MAAATTNEFDEYAVLERIRAITLEASKRALGEPRYTATERAQIDAYRTVANDHGWRIFQDDETGRWLAEHRPG